MVVYDPNVLQKYASILYRKAATIIIAFTLLGLIAGLAVGLTCSEALARSVQQPDATSLITGIIVIVLAYIGYSVGASRAFFYKLQAQLTLCQRQIESNTSRKA